MDITLNHFKGKVGVVTGASAGIGEAIVEALVCRGLQVVGLARRKEKLEQLAKRLQGDTGKFYPFRCDVSKEDDIADAFQWIKTNVGPISILVNNAGFMRQEGLVDGDPKLWKEIFDTNVIGLCIATKYAVKNMMENDISGHIIHINSVVGHFVPCFPNISVYPASKFAVTALTETLRHELNFFGTKIKVTSISPGAVQTEFFTTAGIDLDMEKKGHVATMPFLKSQDIADSVVYVLATPPHVQVHELIIKPIGEKF